MRHGAYESHEVRLSFGGGFTPAVRVLLVLNALVFAADLLLGFGSGGFARQRAARDFLALTPWEVLHHGRIWQLLTYAFLHKGPGHLLVNLLTLWMFSGDVERTMGTRRFAAFYLLCAIGAGAATALLRWNSPHPTVGASGAVYGVLLAYGMLFPDRVIYLYFLFPLPARWVVAFFAVVEILSSAVATGDGIAHLTHLGGMATAWLWLGGTGPGGLLLRWRRRRIKRRLKVIDARRTLPYDPRKRRGGRRSIFRRP
jgi:membrane associated rhomboid family serine protease